MKFVGPTKRSLELSRVGKLQTICKSIIQYCRDAFLNDPFASF